MGAVSIDTKKKEREFEKLNLSDKNVVKYLILYRSKVDKSYGATINMLDSQAGDTFDFNQELIALYASLDKTVENAFLTKKQSKLIKLLYEGNSINDVCEMLGQHRLAVHKMLNRIVDKLTETNNDYWHYVVGHNGYILKESN